jgi:AcrR family transcriptional regulator
MEYLFHCDVSYCHHHTTMMAVTVITYHKVMGRWEPNARGRLARAALTLYAQQGFERTTVTEIAQLAGLTERTFFRNFADKREVLFYGATMAQDLVVRVIAGAPAAASPTTAVSAALGQLCAVFQENSERVRQRDAIIGANAELRERNLTKHAELAAAMVSALLERGIPEAPAILIAETGVAVFRIALARWISDPGEPDLPGIFLEQLAKLRNELADGAAGDHGQMQVGTRE